MPTEYRHVDTYTDGFKKNGEWSTDNPPPLPDARELLNTEIETRSETEYRRFKRYSRPSGSTGSSGDYRTYGPWSTNADPPPAPSPAITQDDVHEGRSGEQATEAGDSVTDRHRLCDFYGSYKVCTRWYTYGEVLLPPELTYEDAGIDSRTTVEYRRVGATRVA